MAFGFPAHHEARFITPHPLTELALQRASTTVKLAYKGQFMGDEGWYWSLGVAMDLTTWGMDVKVWLLAPQHIRIRSQCALPTQCFDWGRNKKTVNALASALLARPS